jgi:hypothetical protein
MNGNNLSLSGKSMNWRSGEWIWAGLREEGKNEPRLKWLVVKDEDLPLSHP